MLFWKSWKVQAKTRARMWMSDMDGSRSMQMRERKRCRLYEGMASSLERNANVRRSLVLLTLGVIIGCRIAELEVLCRSASGSRSKNITAV